MELTKARQGTASMQQRELSKQSKIVMLLTALGIRRQAKLDSEDYLVLSSDLEKYELADLEEAMKVLCSRPRAEGETAFPDLPTILEAIRGVIRARRPPQPTSADRWAAYVEAYKEERMFDGETK